MSDWWLLMFDFLSGVLGIPDESRVPGLAVY
jgi:hypothetical protein